MKYVYAMSIEGMAIKASAHFIKADRQKLDPLGSGSFISIGYWETSDHEIIGLVF